MTPTLTGLPNVFFFVVRSAENTFFFFLGPLAVSPSGPEPTVAPPEVTTGEPLNHAVESLGPVKFLDPSNSLILYFIKNTTPAVSDPTTSLVLPGLPYVTSITTKFDKTPA